MAGNVQQYDAVGPLLKEAADVEVGAHGIHHHGEAVQLAHGRMPGTDHDTKWGAGGSVGQVFVERLDQIGGDYLWRAAFDLVPRIHEHQITVAKQRY